MSENTEKTTEQNELYSENELAQVLKSLESQEEIHTLSEEEIEKVAKAWASVKRDKLFKQ